jgi:hypothetical protein
MNEINQPARRRLDKFGQAIDVQPTVTQPSPALTVPGRPKKMQKPARTRHVDDGKSMA